MANCEDKPISNMARSGSWTYGRNRNAVVPPGSGKQLRAEVTLSPNLGPSARVARFIIPSSPSNNRASAPSRQ